MEAVEPGNDTTLVQHGRRLSFALWALQAILAALFLMAGIMKFVMPIAQMAKQTSLPAPLIHFVGVCEILGAIGLVVPALSRIRPVLTPIAACGLVIIMVGATVVSVPEGWMALFPFLIGVVAAWVAYGRFRLRPIEPRRRF